jgi:hypothetical protein
VWLQPVLGGYLLLKVAADIDIKTLKNKNHINLISLAVNIYLKNHTILVLGIEIFLKVSCASQVLVLGLKADYWYNASIYLV